MSAPAASDSQLLASGRRRELVAILFVALIALGAWWPAFRAAWMWDDDLYVTDNALVQSPDGLADIFGLKREPSNGAIVARTLQYYPLVFGSFWLQYRFVGLEPASYHVVNVLLHCANAWLLWRLARRLGLPGAGFLGAVFLLHPMHVESVAWISERKNLLSGFFALGSLIAYTRFDATRKRRWYGASLALFVASMLAKTVTAPLVLVIPLMVWWTRRNAAGKSRFGARDVIALIPFFVFALVLGAFSAWNERMAVGATSAEFHQTLAERALLIVPRTFVHYATKLAWPHPLMFIYPRFEPDLGDIVQWIYAPIVVLVFFGLWFARRRFTLGPLLLVVASALMLGPALGLVPVFPQRFSWVADHFAYLGSIGWLALYVGAGALGVSTFVQPGAHRNVALAAGVLVLPLLGWRTHVECGRFANRRVLWEHTLAHNPDAWIAMTSLGVELMSGAERTPADEARAHDLFRRAEQYELGSEMAFTDEGLWFEGTGRYDEAATCYRRALQVAPDHRRAKELLADVRFKAARTELQNGHGAAALATIRTGRAESGDSARFSQLEAWILATDPDPKLRDGSRARELAEALAAKKPDDPGIFDTLAAACAEVGDFDAAVRNQETALRLATPSMSATTLAPLRARLELYRARKPFRG